MKLYTKWKQTTDIVNKLNGYQKGKGAGRDK